MMGSERTHIEASWHGFRSGGVGGQPPPPICKPNARMIGLDRIHMLRSELSRFYKGGGGGVERGAALPQKQSSHDGLGRDTLL